MSMIEAEGLVKSFNGLKAVNLVSFSVKKGEIFGFLGPNGAGKTTVVRILTGLLKADSGKAFVDGINIEKNPIAAKMEMGIIPETSNVYVDMTARENVLLAGRFYGLKKDRLSQKADDLLEKLGLYQKRDLLVRHFSKGMRQKVSVACALVNDAKMLFLDEPASGLDVASRKLIREVILETKHSGVTVFLTSHDIQEVNLTCERVAVINKGRIAAIDTPENLKKVFEASQAVEVSFDRLVDNKEIAQLPGVEQLEKLGDKFKIHTSDPDSVIKKLSDLARAKDLSFISLEILKTSLEDVFIQLTGETDGK